MKIRICPFCGRYNLGDSWHCTNESCREVLSVDTITDVPEPLPPDIALLLQNDLSAKHPVDTLQDKKLSRQSRQELPVGETSYPSPAPPRPQFSASAPVDQRYRGVGGWLLFFCLVLTVIGPLLTIVSYIVGYSDTSQYFNRFPGLLTITVIESLIGLGVVSFGIYAGIGLWILRSGAVQVAKRFLVLNLGCSVVIAILPFMAGLPSAVNDAILTEAARTIFSGVIFFSIWNSYLNNSKRVRATYGV